MKLTTDIEGGGAGSRSRGVVRWSVTLSLVLGLAPGCGDGSPLTTVSGKVSYQGKPLEKGTVMFTPRGGVTVSGKIQPDGAFKLMAPRGSEHIPPAEYRAVIITDEGNMAQIGEDPMALGKMKPAIPLEFSSSATTPLTYRIEPGPNVLDINLDEALPEKQ